MATEFELLIVEIQIDIVYYRMYVSGLKERGNWALVVP